MNGSLILFTRYPEPGSTKTRIAARLGDEGAVRLYRALVEHALVSAQRAARNLELTLEVHHTGTAGAMRQWLGEDLVLRPQITGDLGARMAAALDNAVVPVLLIGGDCPTLTEDVVADAFAVLTRRDIVLGPACDGGFYLIGTQRPLGSLLHGLPWGSDRAFQATVSRLQEAGLRAGTTRRLPDIDRPEDLDLLPPSLRSVIALLPKKS